MGYGRAEKQQVQFMVKTCLLYTSIQRFSKIIAGGALYAVIALSHVHVIEISFQNLVFGIFAFQLQSQIGFLDLSLIATLTGQHPVFDKLLGDRTAALNVGGSKVTDCLLYTSKIA